MKRCPQCQRTFEDSLDFCLEDGTRLVPVIAVSPQATVEVRTPQTAAPTVAYPLTPVIEAAGDQDNTAEIETITAKKDILPQTGFGQNTAFGYAAVSVAMLHNWWQWLYLEKQYYSGILDYFLSANFLMWLLLLAGGTTIGLFVVRKSKNKTLGILSLTVIAINLILYLVPKR